MKFQHNTNRLEAFSDGVLAFAATLLVVGFEWDGDFRVLESQGTSFLAFAASFFVLVAFWWVHYNYFRRSGYVDNWIIAVNTVLLFVILYYVFPLKSLVNSFMGQERITMEGLSNLFRMYSLGFALIFLCFAAMYFRSYKKLRAVEPSLVSLFYARHFTIFVLIGVLSMVLATLQAGVQIGLPGFIYALLGPLCFWHAQWFKRKYKDIDQ
ncbi:MULTISPECIES: TMEM175 family protein [Robiginitalea]|uniref:DUF1211 domain-containing protein n=1 Tax=Robiginitalea biformata (strain ATCC BAA-864 / DSM 15991 / KCTC 12146 / HTCC2501) TaxID=313596 RepID=A4CNN3_ROBBH|nr:MULTISPECIES: TMEM175 family protein [Robiginitalea]EAR14500.1 hypothetical protein RB2501_00451 [Robiginitalea biformata HTCC2501]MDC6355015.1 TMEM175 family protein [Robiginitalea sp. PM2]MDC6375282.1 TMEM175 family protein [Robiginitalea sp. SP8]